MARDPFEEIAKRAIDEAEDVRCDFDVFVAGLKTIMDEVRERLDMARDEQQSHLPEED